RGIQDPESKPALSTCEFSTPRGVDDFAGVDRGDHVSVTAASSHVEESHSFHEKRPLFGIEDRKTLVDLNLECIALDLAEIRIDRSVQRDGRCDAVFGAKSKVRFSGRIIPAIWRCANLVNRVRDTRKQFKNARLLQIRKDEMRVPVEDPQARRNIRPRPRHSHAADASPEKNAHYDFFSATKSDAMKRQLDFDGIAVIQEFARAFPHEIGFKTLTG